MIYIDYNEVINLRIFPINSYIKNQNSFGQNKLYVYADFDRTISPNTTSDVFYAKNPEKISLAKYNFDTINALIQKYPNLQFHIETGRANDELQLMYDIYKKCGVNFINADSVILKEGADEFLIDKTKKQEYPYIIKNMPRSLYIRKKTNWGKDRIQTDVKNIINDMDLDPLICGTTLSAEKYGKYSIFSYPEKFTPKTILIRNLGEFKLFLGFVNTIPSEKYKELKNNVTNYLSGNNIFFKIEEKPIDKECNSFRSITYIPIIDGEELSKNYDIKKNINDMDATDTIVLAGDGSNDYPMLNPKSYKEDFLGSIISIIIDKKGEQEPALENLFNTHVNTNNRKIIKIQEGFFADKLKEIAKQKFGF